MATLVAFDSALQGPHSEDTDPEHRGPEAGRSRTWSARPHRLGSSSANAGYRLLWADNIRSDGEFVLFMADAPEWYNLFAVVGQVIRNEAGIPTAFANDHLWVIDTIDGAEGTVSETFALSGNLSRGTGINGLDVVRTCGWYGLQGGFGNAGPLGFVWELDVNAGTPRTIDLNPRPLSPSAYSEGMAVNGVGQVAFRLGEFGGSVGGEGIDGYFWNGDLSAEPELIRAADTREAVPYGLDNAGTVVGRTSYLDGAQFAFIWTAGTGLRDLNTIVNTPNRFDSAHAINSAGQILVRGYGAEANGGRYMVVERNGNW